MTAPANGIGPQYPQPDPRGWLVFKYLPPDLQRAEDRAYAADSAVVQHQSGGYDYGIGYGRTVWFRAATDTERTLLQHLGHTLPDDLVTRIEYLTASVRNRRWPSLEENQT